MRVFIRNSILVLTVVSAIIGVTSGQQCVTLIVGSNAANYTGISQAIGNFTQGSNVFALYQVTIPMPLQYSYDYYGSAYIQLNSFAESTGAYFKSVTASMNMVLNQLLLAANNTSPSNAVSILGQLNNTILAAINNVTSNYNGSMPLFAMTNLTAITSGIVTQLQNLQSMISQAIALNIQNTSSYTILGFVPGNLAVSNLVNNMTMLASYYNGNASAIYNYTNNIYSLLKSSDSNLNQIEKQYNISNAYILGPATTLNAINTTLISAFISMNNTINSYFNSFSVALKNNINLNSTFDSFRTQLLPQLYDQTNQTIMQLYQTYQQQWQMQMSSSINQTYMSIQSTAQMARQSLVNDLTRNASLYSCGANLISQTNTLFAAGGNATNMFNCSTVDIGVFNRSNNVFQVLLNNFLLEFNYTMSAVADCPTVVPVSTSGTNQYYTYSAETCFQQSYMLVSLQQNQYSMFLSNIQMIYQNYLQANSQREQTCFYKSQMKLLGTYAPAYYTTYQNCTQPGSVTST